MPGLEGLISEDSGDVVDTRKPERLLTTAGATLRETLVSNPAASIYRAADLGLATYGSRESRMPAEEARARIKSEGFDGQLLVPDNGITPEALGILIDRKHDERLRQEIFDNAPRGFGAGTLNLSMALAGSLTDPLNIASAFVPVVGEERAAALLGKAAGVLRRTAVRAGVGAIEGTAGAALVEPLVYTAKQQEQADYDMGNSLLNVGFGGVFGSGLHVSGGALGDAWRYARGSAGDVAARVAPETRAQTLKSAIAQSINGERVNVDPIVNLDPRAQQNYIERAANLSEADRAIESRFADRVRSNPDELVDAYSRLEESNGGKTINTDTVRELSPDYLADRSKAAAVHEPASFLTKEIYRRRLAEAKPGGEVIFAAGGAGSGKSSGLKLLGVKDQLVYDGTLSKLNGATHAIDQALAAKQNARIVFTYRDVSDALRAALKRATDQETLHGTGRTVPLDAFEQGHRGARDVFEKLLEKYGQDDRVRFDVIDNTRGQGEARRVKFDDLPAAEYNRLREKLHAQVEAAHASGTISDAVRRGFSGPSESELGRLRAADRGQPEPQRAQQGSDAVGDPLAAVRQAAEAPKLSTVADEHAAAAGDEAIATETKILARTDQPTLEDVAAIDEDTAEILAQLKAADIESDAAMADADQLVKDADTYAKAARAAVVCGLNHA